MLKVKKVFDSVKGLMNFGIFKLILYSVFLEF
jgi:hypothetical protein